MKKHIFVALLFNLETALSLTAQADENDLCDKISTLKKNTHF